MHQERDLLLSEFERWWGTRRESFFDALRRLSTAHPAPKFAPGDAAGLPVRIAAEPVERRPDPVRPAESAAPAPAPIPMVRPYTPWQGATA